MYKEGQTVLAWNRDEWRKATYIKPLNHKGREGQHLVTILPKHELMQPYTAIVQAIEKWEESH